MVLWSLAIALTAIACAALYYAAAGRSVNALASPGEAATEAHFRLQLNEIGADVDAGRLPATEVDGARRELAREYLRTKAGAGAAQPPIDRLRQLVPLPLVAAAIIAFATYAYLG